MTVVEALQNAEGILNGISVPVGLNQQIAMPIGEALMHIDACLRYFEEHDKPAEEQPAAESPETTEEQADG